MEATTKYFWVKRIIDIDQLLQLNKSKIVIFTFLGKSEYLFEAITDTPLANWGVMAICCRVLLSAVLTYNALSDPKPTNSIGSPVPQA